jgi:hypothetical protein
MNLATDLLWTLGTVLSLGFVAYGGFLILLVPGPAAAADAAAVQPQLAT